MTLLAIDASSKSTGIAIFKQNQLIHYECISSSSGDMFKRVDIMTSRIGQLCNLYKPTNIVLQDILPQDIKHNQTIYKTLTYLQMSIQKELHNYGLSAELVVASHWRATCGIKTGKGIKRQHLKQASQKLVKSIYHIDVNDDISDAVCIGIAYISQHRSAF